MDPAGFTTTFSGGVGFYHESGRAYTPEERRNIAKRKGICVTCGVRTHNKAILRNTPLTNDEVWKGICLRCTPDQCPAEAVDKYRQHRRTSSSRKAQSMPNIPPSPAPPSRPLTSSSPVTSRRGLPSSDSARSNNRSRTMLQRGSPSRQALPSKVSNTSLKGMGDSTAFMDASESSSRGISPQPTSQRHMATSNRAARLPTAPDLVAKVERSISEEALHTTSMDFDQNVSSSSMGSRPSSQRPLYAVPSGSLAEQDETPDSLNSSEQIVEALSTTANEPERLKDVLNRIRCLPIETSETILDLETVIDALAGIVDGSRSDPAVLTAACGAIWRINAALNDDNKKSNSTEADDHEPGIMVQSGVCVMIVENLRRHYSSRDGTDLCEWALGALTSLAQSAPNRAAIVQADGAHAVLEVLQQHGESNAGIFEWSCRCLHALVCTSSADGSDGDDDKHAVTRAIVEEGDGVAVIVRSMAPRVKESQALLWGVEVLWHLAEYSEDAEQTRAQNEMIKNNFLDTGEKMLRSRSVSSALFLRTTELLARLLMISNDPSHYSVVSHCTNSVVRVVNNPKEDTANVKAGCRLLASLSNGDEETRTRLRGSGSLSAAVKASTRDPDCLDLAETVAWIIYRLSLDSSVSTPDADKAVGALGTLVNQHGLSKNLILSSCGCVRNLSQKLSTETRSAAYGILERAVASFVEDSAVLGQVMDALFSLSQLDPDGVDAFFVSVDLPLLIGEFPKLTGQNVRKAYQLVGSMSSKSQASRERLMSSGALASVAHVLQGKRDEALQTMLLGLISVLVSSDPLQKIHLPETLVKETAKFIVDESTPDHIVKNACTALRNLMLVSATPFRAQGLTDSLWRVISSKNVELAVEACGVLWALAQACPEELEDKTEVAFKSVVGVFAMHCSEVSVYHKELLAVAAAALANITRLLRSSFPIRFDTDDVDALVAAVYKTLENEDEEVIVLTYLLVALEDLYHVNRDVMIHIGLMVVVIDIMVDRENHAPIQEIGCRILSMLASLGDLQIRLSIIQTDGVDMMISALALFRENTRLQSYGCKAFSYLCTEEESRNLILSQNGIGICASAASSHKDDQDLQNNAWQALSTMVSSAVDEDLIVGSGLVEAAVGTMLKFPLVEPLQDACLGVLCKVSACSPGVRRLILQSRGVECIVAAIQEFIGNKSMLKVGLEALAALAADSGNGTQSDFSNAGNAVLVAMMASINNEEAQEAACSALNGLASFDKGSLIQSGGTDAVFYSIQVHYTSYKVQTAAFKALASITSGQTAENPISVTEGQVQQVLWAMKRFPGLPSIQGDACSMLSNLMYWPENLHVMKDIGTEVTDALEKAACTCPSTCRETVEQAVVVLRTS